MKILLVAILFFLIAPSCKSPQHQPQTMIDKEKQDFVSVKNTTRQTDAITLSASLSKFIPEGYSVLDTVSGNLNLDQYIDYILILKRDSEKTDTVEDARPMLLCLGQANGSFVVAARNDSAVMCLHCGGILGYPYESTEIKQGSFTVNHFGGSGGHPWNNEATFKYSPKDKNWFLIHYASSYLVSLGNGKHNEIDNSTDKTAKDFGKISFSQFNIITVDTIN